MTDFDLFRFVCNGNPGAMTFCAEALAKDRRLGSYAIWEAMVHNIIGTDLYKLWNDCLDRDTEATCKVLTTWDSVLIRCKIRGDGRMGEPISKDEIEDEHNLKKLFMFSGDL